MLTTSFLHAAFFISPVFCLLVAARQRGEKNPIVDLSLYNNIHFTLHKYPITVIPPLFYFTKMLLVVKKNKKKQKEKQIKIL